MADVWLQINTLYVGNLPAISPPTLPPNFLEESLRVLFQTCPGYKRMSFRQKINGPMCFVEFEEVGFAANAIQTLYGHSLVCLILPEQYNIEDDADGAEWVGQGRYPTVVLEKLAWAARCQPPYRRCRPLVRWHRPHSRHGRHVSHVVQRLDPLCTHERRIRSPAERSRAVRPGWTSHCSHPDGSARQHHARYPGWHLALTECSAFRSTFDITPQPVLWRFLIHGCTRTRARAGCEAAGPFVLVLPRLSERVNFTQYRFGPVFARAHTRQLLLGLERIRRNGQRRLRPWQPRWRSERMGLDTVIGRKHRDRSAHLGRFNLDYHIIVTTTYHHIIKQYRQNIDSHNHLPGPDLPYPSTQHNTSPYHYCNIVALRALGS